MKKILSFILLGLMCSIGNLWAEDATFTMSSIFDGNNQSATVTSPVDASISTTTGKGNAKDGKLGSDGNYFQIVLTSRTFSAASMNGYINTTSTDKNWGFQFSTDGGANWSAEVTLANDGTKSAHDISVGVTIPTGANGIRIIRRAGTATIVNSITLTLNSTATYTATYVANGSGEANVVDDAAQFVAANPFTWAGHAFTGWNTAADGTGTPYAVGDALTGDITLYAQWATIYSVTYKANGGTGDDIVDNAAISIAANTFTAPAGKMFVGWNTAANGSGTSYAVGAAVSSNLTLFAQWQTIYGELIKATLTSGSAATVTGVIGGTADVSLSSSKKMDKGKYFGVSLASDSFQEGDTVIITMTTVGSNYPCLFEDKDRTNCLFLATATSSDLVYKIVLPAAANGLTTLYLSRDANDSIYKWNPVLSSFAVVRPMPIVSEAWESLTIDNGPTSYNRTGTVVNVVDAYLDPTVVVTKHVVYADATEANVDVEVTDLEVVGNQYVGHVTIGGDVYTINIAKLASYDVTYMDGEVVLGTEVVAANGHPAEFADYQNPQLATFGGWYRDANLTNQVANIASEIISANATYYAKYTKYYATSINIEKYALRSGKDSVKTVELVAQMGAQHYASNFAYDAGNNEIDYLNDSKDNRNYAYLGLKIKSAGTMLNFRVASGNTVKVKFGNVATAPKVSINGGDYEDMIITDHVYSYTAVADALVSIKTADAKAVVLQQIAIGEELEASELEVEVTLGENGYSTFATDYKYTVEGAEVYKAAYNGSDAVTLTEVVDAVVPANAGIILKGTAGEIVTLTASGSAATELAGNGLVGVVAPLAASAGMYVLSTNAGVTAFNPCQAGVQIPAHKAYISIPSNAPAIRIIFAENGATGINELEGAEKAV